MNQYLAKLPWRSSASFDNFTPWLCTDTLAPTIVKAGHLLNLFAVPRRDIVCLRPVGFHVEEFPLLLESRNQLPVSLPNHSAPFMLPINSGVTLSRLSSENRDKALAFQRPDFVSAIQPFRYFP